MQRAQTVLSSQLSITVDLQKEEADYKKKNENKENKNEENSDWNNGRSPWL